VVLVLGQAGLIEEMIGDAMDMTDVSHTHLTI
jgi:hypothetical protein